MVNHSDCEVRDAELNILLVLNHLLVNKRWINQRSLYIWSHEVDFLGCLLTDVFSDETALHIFNITSD
jgi:hypothetical protein